jgi:hypothetical protein
VFVRRVAWLQDIIVGKIHPEDGSNNLFQNVDTFYQATYFKILEDSNLQTEEFRSEMLKVLFYEWHENGRELHDFAL